MKDRGENIVNLAREMLSAARETDGFRNFETETNGFDFKTLLLATLLTAFGSTAITQWIDDARRPINYYERVELDALLFYVARTEHKDEALIRQNIRSELKLTGLDNISVADYRRARDLLRRQLP